jgi:hypothetical protein
MQTGMELDGIWNKRRVVWSIIGILVGIFLYFGAKSFVLHPEDAGGKFLWPQRLSFFDPSSNPISFLLVTLAPMVGLVTLGARIVQHLMTGPGKNPPYRVPATKLILSTCLALFVLGMIAPGAVTSDPMKAGEGPYYLDLSLKSLGSDVGVDSAYTALSPGFNNEATGGQGRGARYFSNLSGVYYLF